MKTLVISLKHFTSSTQLLEKKSIILILGKIPGATLLWLVSILICFKMILVLCPTRMSVIKMLGTIVVIVGKIPGATLLWRVGIRGNIKTILVLGTQERDD